VKKKKKPLNFFHKVILKQDPAVLNINNNSEEKLALTLGYSGVLTNFFLVDITFNKYILDNIGRISLYENYRQESCTAYLKLYEPDNIELNELNKKNEDI
jgi:hypothetical protein